jgi:dienelactone hydrolase
LQVTTVTTGLRDGPDYGTQTLYVPEGAEPPLAAVAIVPGFNTPESSIQAWGPFLASHGIVALTIGTNNPADSAELRSRALLDALETLRAENARAGRALEGQLATDRLGIMGWSLGGGGALIAASSTPSLKALVTMAAYGPGAQYPQDQVPTLFLAGSADPNAGGQSQGMFASLPDTTPKMLFEVQGGPHEIGNDPQNADGEIGRYGLSWLEVFLVGDERYRQFLTETPAQASDFRQNLSGTPAAGG